MVIAWDAVQGAVAAAGLIGTGAAAVVTRIYPWWRAKRNGRLLERRISGRDFPATVIQDAVRYFVEPLCTDVDPTGREDYRSVFVMSQPFFRTMDRLLYGSPLPQHAILLADSGIGKTTSLLNYYAYNLRRRHSKPIYLVALGRAGAIERIAAISDPENSFLFLDALDEDVDAVRDHVQRVHDLMEAASRFQAVVITCRSQFFLSDEEIIRETGLVRLGPRPAGETGEYVLKKFYLAPFSDAQVQRFLRLRYPLGQGNTRRRARELLRKIGDLSARPMILTYINDLLRESSDEADPIAHVTEAYERIINAWLARERRYVNDVDALQNFSEQLAIDLYVGRELRGGEVVSVAEVRELALRWNINIETWKLTGRSLLNRNAVGQFKFSHRSIMEYLIVKAAFQGDYMTAWTKPWTGQMLRFAEELIIRSVEIPVKYSPHDLVTSGQKQSITQTSNLRLHSDSLIDAATSGHLAVRSGILAISAELLRGIFKGPDLRARIGYWRGMATYISRLVQLVTTASKGTCPEIVALIDVPPNHSFRPLARLTVSCYLIAGERMDAIPRLPEKTLWARTLENANLRENNSESRWHIGTIPGKMLGPMVGDPKDGGLVLTTDSADSYASVILPLTEYLNGRIELAALVSILLPESGEITLPIDN